MLRGLWLSPYLLTPERLEGRLEQQVLTVLFACTVHSPHMYDLDTLWPLSFIAARYSEIRFVNNIANAVRWQVSLW